MTDTQQTTTGVTVDTIVDILTRCVAEPAVDPASEIGATDFTDLGYDSLAVLECAAVLETEHGVLVPDDVLGTLRTPQQMVDYVNTRRRAA